MEEHTGRRHRESPSTYRRRRLVVVACAVFVVAVPVLLVARLGDDSDRSAIETASAETTHLTADADVTATDAASAPTTTVTTASTRPAGPAAGTPTTSGSGVAGYSSPYEFLACVRARESRGDYAAVSTGGGTFGAYQIDQVTWNSTAQHAGLWYLHGIQPNLALPSGQDAIAMALLQWQGAGPWAGGCAYPAPGT